MLRFSRASSSAVRLHQRGLATSSLARSSNQSDGLFPQSSAPKQELDRHAAAAASDPLSAAPPGLSTLGRRRLPALKSMTAPPTTASVAQALGLAPAAEDNAGQSAAAEDAPPADAPTPTTMTAPTSALDAFLPSSRASTPPAPGGSSILASILASPLLTPAAAAGAGKPQTHLSLSSPYLPSSTTSPAWAAAHRAQSIFQQPPTPPPTHTLIVNLKVSRNNALATVAYAHDGSIPAGCAQISAGTVGFKRAAQGGFEAGHQVAVAILRAIREENGRKLRAKRDSKKVFYRAKAEERRLELVQAFEALKGEQQRLAAEKKALDDGLVGGASEALAPPAAAAAAAAGTPAAANPAASSTSSMYAASTPLAETTSVAPSAPSSSPPAAAVASPASKQAASVVQRRAALATSQKALSDSLAAYNASVRLLSSELRDLKANKIPTDALLPRAAAEGDVSQEVISAELLEAEEQSAGQVGVYFKVFIRGFGQGRDAFLTALMGREGHFVRPLCTGLGDASPMKCVRSSLPSYLPPLPASWYSFFGERTTDAPPPSFCTLRRGGLRARQPRRV